MYTYTVEPPVSGHPRDLVEVSAYGRLHVTMQTMGRADLCFWIIRTLIFEDINWPPIKGLPYFAHLSHAEKVMQQFKATS